MSGAPATWGRWGGVLLAWTLGMIPVGCGGAAPAVPGELTWSDTVVTASDSHRLAAEVGRLVVGPEAGTVELSLLRLPRTRPAGVPLVYLGPWPGESAAEALLTRPTPVLDSLRARGDVVAVDLRGSGGSVPRGWCGEFDWPFEGRGRPGTGWVRRIGSACADSARRAGLDVADLLPGAAARDLEVLRVAFGADRLVLLGDGFGADVAVAYAARHPERVERLALLRPRGAGGLERSRRYERVLLELAAEDSATGPDMPMLSALAAAGDSLLGRVIAAPARDGHLVLLSEWDLRRKVAHHLSRGSGLDSLPGELRGMARGEWLPLADYVHDARKTKPLSYVAVANACAEMATRSAPVDTAGYFAGIVDWPYAELCATVGPAGTRSPDLPPAGAPRLPTLTVRGARDPAQAPLSLVEAGPGLILIRIVHGSGAGDPLLEPAALSAVLRYLSGEVVDDDTLSAEPTP